MNVARPSEKGYADWLWERGTALVLMLGVPWLGFHLGQVRVITREGLILWLHQPLNSFLLILLILIAAIHASLGLRTILTDYIRHRARRTLLLIIVRCTLASSAIIGLGSLGVLLTSPP
jgi:succinate dehydrogenase hydrophobic membrane anchor protein